MLAGALLITEHKRLTPKPIGFVCAQALSAQCGQGREEEKKNEKGFCIRVIYNSDNDF